MLLTLVIVAGLSIWLALLQYSPVLHWRRALLRTAVFCGVYATLIAEFFSLFHAITPLNLAVAWGLLAFGAWFPFRRNGTGSPLRSSVIAALRTLRGWDAFFVAVMLCIVLIVGVVAFSSPPQSVDSLNYHMSRVAHWAQNQSLDHYATGIESQNSMNPGSEILLLHVYVLAGGDRFVNGVQWLAMCVSIIAAVEIVAQLGAGRKGQLLAAVIVITLPMGLAEASNTMSDYVAALWTVLAVSELLQLREDAHEEAQWIALLCLAMAAGLSFLTKATTGPYLVMAALFSGGFLWKHRRERRLLLAAAAGTAIILALNGGYLLRNLQTYGQPLGEGHVSRQQNTLLDASGILSNVVRNAALHVGTPWKALNDQMFRLVVAVHVKLGVDLHDPRTTGFGFFTIGPPTTEEASAGNPLHTVLGVTACVFLLLFWTRESRINRLYLVSLAAGFVLFSMVFKWQIWGSRLQLPFFVLLAPITGVLLARRLPRVAVHGISALLLACSWPWVVSISSRPLLPNAQSRTDQSILTLTRRDLFALTTPWLGDTVSVITEPIREQNCREIGLMLSGTGMEYLYWDALGAPDAQLVLEWIVSDTPSARYEVEDFAPCAVICEGCPDEWQSVRSVPYAFSMGDTTLFLATTP